MSDKNDTEIEILAAAAKEWVESTSGMSALNDLAEKVVLISEGMTKDNQIDQVSLRKPVTF